MTDRHPHTPMHLAFLTSCWSIPSLAETVQKDAPASLARLHDIVVPAPLSPWWPLAPGWYLLAGLFLLLAGWSLWRMRRRRRARRYRVEALAELRALRRHSAEPHELVAGILVVLKRTALAAYPRAQVAGLNGAAWWRFLDLSGGTRLFAEELGVLAEGLVYAQQDADETSQRAIERLYRAAEQWVRQHRPSDPRAVSDDTPGVGA